MNDSVITEEALKIRDYIEKTWGGIFTVRVEVPLRVVFPEPQNVGLRHIWKWGSADLVVCRDGEPIAIIEPGGSHHWEEKQSLNDRRKWKLADINGVRGITLMNGVMDALSKRKFRAMMGAILFGRKTT